jgi:hypothetical protein
MKSTATYQIIRKILAPSFKEHGFHRSKPGALCWRKPLGANFLVVGFETESAGYDPPRGCSFTMELQISPLAELGAWGEQCVRHRLPNILTDEELEQVRILQNRVRSRLNKPTADHWIYQSKTLRLLGIDHYLSQFEQITAWTHPNYKNMLWFQYQDEADVKMWANFILATLPQALQRMEQEFEALT